MFAITKPIGLQTIFGQLPELPFKVEIADVRNPLCCDSDGALRKISIVTSTQVSHMMFQEFRSPEPWSIRPCNYRMCFGDDHIPTLRWMLVSEIGQEFKAPPPKPRKKKAARNLLNAVLNTDRKKPDDSDEDPGGPPRLGDVSEDGDAFKLYSDPSDGDGVDDIVDGILSEEEIEPVEETDEELKLLEIDYAGEPAPRTPVLCVVDYVRATHIGFDGRFTCDIDAAFSDRILGSISYFPVEAPPMKQRVAIRCMQHTNCSLLRGRKHWPDPKCLKWFWEGALDESCKCAADHAELAKDADRMCLDGLLGL